MFYVYVLYSDNFKRTYKSLTKDVDKRLIQHNLKQNKSTKEREKYLKTGVGRAYIKNFITFEE